MYKTTLVKHKIPIIGKTEQKYTKQLLRDIKYKIKGNQKTDIQNKSL
jgi:hypothetical protein